MVKRARVRAPAPLWSQPAAVAPLAPGAGAGAAGARRARGEGRFRWLVFGKLAPRTIPLFVEALHRASHLSGKAGFRSFHTKVLVRAYPPRSPPRTRIGQHLRSRAPGDPGTPGTLWAAPPRLQRFQRRAAVRHGGGAAAAAGGRLRRDPQRGRRGRGGAVGGGRRRRRVRASADRAAAPDRFRAGGPHARGVRRAVLAQRRPPRLAHLRAARARARA
eukprot:gene10631-biopygen7778